MTPGASSSRVGPSRSTAPRAFAGPRPFRCSHGGRCRMHDGCRSAPTTCPAAASTSWRSRSQPPERSRPTRAPMRHCRHRSSRSSPATDGPREHVEGLDPSPQPSRRSAGVSKRSPAVAVDDIVEGSAAGSPDRGGRPVGRVAERDQVGDEVVGRVPQDVAGEVLVGDGGVAGSDAEVGCRSMMLIVAWPRSYWSQSRCCRSSGSATTRAMVAAESAMWPTPIHTVASRASWSRSVTTTKFHGCQLLPGSGRRPHRAGAEADQEPAHLPRRARSGQRRAAARPPRPGGHPGPMAWSTVSSSAATAGGIRGGPTG